MSRDSILSAIQANKPARIALDDYARSECDQETPLVDLFIANATLIGASVIRVHNFDVIKSYLAAHFESSTRIVTSVKALSSSFEVVNAIELPHQYANLELAVLEAHFGVAENGAVWLTEDQMGNRVMPFICQHLAVLVTEDRVVKNMHSAYECIGSHTYGFGTFIAGPSKTADIEQSLVIGAHGARSMLIFLLPEME